MFLFTDLLGSVATDVPHVEIYLCIQNAKRKDFLKKISCIHTRILLGCDRAIKIWIWNSKECWIYFACISAYEKSGGKNKNKNYSITPKRSLLFLVRPRTIALIVKFIIFIFIRSRLGTGGVKTKRGWKWNFHSHNIFIWFSMKTLSLSAQKMYAFITSSISLSLICEKTWWYFEWCGYSCMSIYGGLCSVDVQPI